MTSNIWGLGYLMEDFSQISSVGSIIHAFNPLSCLQAMQLVRDIETKMIKIHPETGCCTGKSNNWQWNNIALPLKFRAGMQNCEKISETKLNSSWNGRNDKNYGLEAESFTKQRSCFLFDAYREEEWGDQRNSWILDFWAFIK